MTAPTGNNYVTTQYPGAGLVRFVQGTDTTLTPKSLYVAGSAAVAAGGTGTNGSNVFGAIAVNGDATTAHVVSLLDISAAGTSIVNALNIPVNSGVNGTVAPVALMTAAAWPGLVVDNNGNPYYYVANGHTLSAEFASTLSAGSTITVYCATSDFGP